MPAMPQAPTTPAAALTCCACARPATGKVRDMLEVRGEDKQWQWQQAPTPRGYCPFHESKHSAPRWIDRNNKAWDAQPPSRGR